MPKQWRTVLPDPPGGMAPVDEHWDSIAAFTDEMIASRDIDPIYPILRRIGELRELKRDELLWLSVLYVAVYNLPSALDLWHRLGPFNELDHTKIEALLPKKPTTGTERRGMRGRVNLPKYLHTLLDKVNYRVAPCEEQLHSWLTREWWSRGARGGDSKMSYRGRRNYHIFWNRWLDVPGNGRWSGFKMAEILRRVHDMVIEAPDMQLKLASGPREGLEWLYHARDDIVVLERCASDLQVRLSQHRNEPVDWETEETILCNFNSLRQGHYYVGHDIDELQAQMERSPVLRTEDKALLYQVRSDVLPAAYLGELHDWVGIQHERLSVWRDQHIVLTRP